MATYVLSKDTTVPSKLALSSLRDFLGEDGLATVVELEATPWATQVVDDMGLGTVKSLPKFTHLDTVIGPADEELVTLASTSGATYLSIAEGLIPLEIEAEVEVPESPDMENIPEPKPEPQPEPVVEKAKPTAPRKKRKPLPEVPAPVAEAVTETIIDKVEEVTLTFRPDETESDLLIRLIIMQLEGLRNDPLRNDPARLWTIADMIRDA